MHRHLLSSVARRILAASPDSFVGRIVAQLRETARTHHLDSRNMSEFGDLSTHERMLADSVRVDAYARAVAKYVQADDVVLDLGTGAGILALLAARRARKVYAVDHSEILDVARLVAQANGIENIEFVRANSRDFTPPERVTVVLHEQIGDELYEENMVDNVIDLRDRVLAPGGRILPARFKLFLEPVMLRDAYSVPFIWQMKVQGLDYSALRGHPVLSRYPRTNDLRWQHRLKVERLLCEPAPVATLDLATVGSADYPTYFEVRRTAACAGRLDGLYVYVGVDFGDGIYFETSPSTVTSWGNQFFRAPPTHVAGGESIAFDVEVPEARDVSSWLVTMHRPALGRLR